MKLGFQGALRYKVGGISAGGSFTTLTNCTDVDFSLEAGEADASTRGAGGMEQTEPALFKAGLDFEMQWDPADPGLVALRTAFLTRAVLGIQALDDAPGAPNNGQGLQCDMKVFKFAPSQKLTETQKVSVSLKPCYSTTAWSWVTT